MNGGCVLRRARKIPANTANRNRTTAGRRGKPFSSSLPIHLNNRHCEGKYIRPDLMELPKNTPKLCANSHRSLRNPQTLLGKLSLWIVTILQCKIIHSSCVLYWGLDPRSWHPTDLTVDEWFPAQHLKCRSVSCQCMWLAAIQDETQRKIKKRSSNSKGLFAGNGPDKSPNTDSLTVAMPQEK